MLRWVTLISQWGGLALIAVSGVVLYLIVAFVPDQSRVAVSLYLPLMALGFALAVAGYRWGRQYRRAGADVGSARRARGAAPTLNSLMTVSVAETNSGAADVAMPAVDEQADEPPASAASLLGDALELPSFTVDLELATAKSDRFAIDPRPSLQPAWKG